MVNAAAFPEVAVVRYWGRHTANTLTVTRHSWAGGDITGASAGSSDTASLGPQEKGSRERRTRGTQEGPGLNTGRRGWNSIRTNGHRGTAGVHLGKGWEPKGNARLEMQRYRGPWGKGTGNFLEPGQIRERWAGKANGEERTGVN